jgi:uncharacterized protein (DUF58 family)
MAFAIVIGALLLAALTGWLGIPWLSGASLVAIVAYALLGYLSKPKAPKPPTQAKVPPTSPPCAGFSVLVAVNRRIEIGKELEMEVTAEGEQRRARRLRQNTVVKIFHNRR